MELDFNVKDILHRIQVRFVHTFLPEAKKGCSPVWITGLFMPA